MKSVSAFLLSTFLLASLINLQGCGKKGPLYHPEHQAQTEKQAANSDQEQK